jgi:uncharacterized repeat protein (TIGR01451 family)
MTTARRRAGRALLPRAKRRRHAGLGSALLALSLLPAIAAAAIGVNKAFAPASAFPDQVSVLTLSLVNPNTSDAINLSVTDTLPAGLVVAPAGVVSNTCGGTVVAVPGTGSIVLSNGTVPAAVTVSGTCTVQVQVRAATIGTYINIITPAQVSSSQGGTTANTSATFTVTPFLPITGNKGFVPGNLHGNGPATRMSITLSNPNAVALTGVAFTDTFPATLQVAASANVSSTCAGTVSAAPGALAVSLAGGTLPANGSCVVALDVAARNPDTIPFDANSTNAIAAGGVTSAEGVSNAAAVSGSVRVQKAARVAKAFSPATIAVGGTSSLTLTLSNFNRVALSGVNLVDSLPAGMTATAVTGNTCGGTATFAAGSVSLSGGTVPAAPAAIGAGTCTVTAAVTSAAIGTYANTVPAGTLGGVAFSAATGTLTVTASSSVSGTKAFTPTATRPQTGVATLVITLSNTAATAASITSFTDALTSLGTGFTVAASPAASTTCPGSTLGAAPGSTSITLAGGSIPANGSCTLTVPVQVAANATTGSRTNSVLANALVTSQGNNTTVFTSPLTVPAALAASKAFAPAAVLVSGLTRLTVTVSKPVNTLPLTNLSVTDNLVPIGAVVAPVPNATNTCGGTLSAAPGATSVQLTGGTAFNTAAAATCTFSVSLQARATPGTVTNTLAAGTVTASSAVGPVSAAAVSQNLVINSSQVSLNKAFSPSNISPGEVSQLTLFVENNLPGSLALTGVNLADALPAGMVVAPAPGASFSVFSGAGPCTPGTLNAVPGAAAVGITGGTVGLNSVCRLRVNVTASAVGSLRNVVPAGSLVSTQGVTNANAPEATLLSSGAADVALSKTDGQGQMAAGESTTYTVVVRNLDSTETATGVEVSDPAPAGMSFTAWTCTPSAGSVCDDASGSGDILSTVTLLPGGTATFSVTALLDSGFTGNTVRNTVTATSTVIFDPNLGNNTAFDENSVVRIGDLSLTKSSGGSELTAGQDAVYSLVASNIGPSDADGAIVSDPPAPGLSCTAVACAVLSGSASCPAGLTVAGLQGGVAIADFPAGSSLEFTLTCTVTATGL